MHITVAILLYADDAALPADTAEDLALSARILEEFCNDMRLYVSVPKTFVTVFHDTSDEEVKYVGNNVLVDGHRVVVKIYGSEINATASFKYLGVVLDASGNPAAHLCARFDAFERAGNGLINGLRRIPAHTHSFVQYLWQALVLPVALYGVELFAWAEKDQSRFMSLQRGLGRRLLKLGGRAPNDVTDHLLGVRSCTIEWRTGRVSLLLRLLNAPTDSWQHAALLFYFTNNTDWYRAGLEDLCRVFPLVNLNLGHNLKNGQPFVYSTGDWVDKEWHSGHPYDLRRGLAGQRPLAPSLNAAGPYETQAVRKHIKLVSGRLRLLLARESHLAMVERTLSQHRDNPHSKSAMLSMTICGPSPPLSTALDRAGPVSHAAALAGWIGGDFFLARYAGNYFAKALLPTETQHLALLAQRSVESSRICLQCWDGRREIHLEDELHVLLRCPSYDRQRQDFLAGASPNLVDSIAASRTEPERTKAFFSSHAQYD